jgi:hypothetical protein
VLTSKEVSVVSLRISKILAGQVLRFLYEKPSSAAFPAIESASCAATAAQK